MIKGYIFDYGGTLDTAGHHWGKVLWHAYERQQVPVDESHFREAYVYGERTLGSMPIIKHDYTFRKTLEIKLRLELEYLCKQGIWDADEATFKQLHQAILEDVYTQVVATTTHSREVLERLSERYPMVLVSNFYGNMEVVLKEFGLNHLFGDVVESAIVGIRKPDPRIYKLGVERLRLLPEKVIVVGDSFYKDIEPARKIGCKTVWFKGEGWTTRQYDERIPDRIITDIAQLSSIVL